MDSDNKDTRWPLSAYNKQLIEAMKDNGFYIRDIKWLTHRGCSYYYMRCDRSEVVAANNFLLKVQLEALCRAAG